MNDEIYTLIGKMTVDMYLLNKDKEKQVQSLLVPLQKRVEELTAEKRQLEEQLRECATQQNISTKS